jgi:IS30 family transposase
MSYKHLSQEERYQIAVLRKLDTPQNRIAALLGRCKSTISREIARNSAELGYAPLTAHRKATLRSLNCRNARRIPLWALQLACGWLRLRWSPEQIASQAPLSHESLYQQIYAQRAAGGDLWRYLRCHRKRRRRHASGRGQRGQIANRRRLGERPDHVQERKQVGHWECDTVIGAGNRQALVTLVERKSGYVVMAKVAHKSAHEVSRAIIDGLLPLAKRVKTLTYDNGKEFAWHAQVDTALGSTGYFADPHSPWQRGSNENLNGLLRQYVPKDRPLETVSKEELQMIQNQLNHRPRKRLGYKTPAAVFLKSLDRVALRA